MLKINKKLAERLLNPNQEMMKRAHKIWEASEDDEELEDALTIFVTMVLVANKHGIIRYETEEEFSEFIDENIETIGPIVEEIIRRLKLN